MIKYTKPELWKIYEKLPKELQQVIFSEETANNIYNACKRNGVKITKTISKIAENTGYVLLGVISLKEFKTKSAKETKLKKKNIEAIYEEIIKSVFFPVRDSLKKTHGIVIKSEEAQISGPSNGKTSQKEKPEEIIDKYMEPIE
ncbi:MAG: hypothetical protein U9Q16_00075 [Patescibacteria group bacterium]|nr:hypothetical protein [Patescibacteria group bacterium]